MEARKCSRCSHVVQDDAAFCSQCGQPAAKPPSPRPVPAELQVEKIGEVAAPFQPAVRPERPQPQATGRKCPECGADLEERFKFCHECGTRAASKAPTMKIVARPPSGGQQVIPLDGSPITMGSCESSTVRIDDPHVSKRHCQIVANDAGEYWIEDLGSRNGTFMKLIAAAPIKPGDTFLVGTTLVTVESD